MSQHPLRRSVRGRAFGHGLGRATATVLAAVTLAAGVAACGGGGGSSSLPDNTLPGGKRSALGALPAYLPKGATADDTVLQGTAQRPALASQGDAVDVHLGDAVVQTRVTGPVTPPTGQVPEPATVLCTWKVTLTDLSGTASGIALDQWSIQSGQTGQVYHPGLAPGSAPFPATLSHGASVTVTLGQNIASGEGLVRWAPGNTLLSSWDYIAEID